MSYVVLGLTLLVLAVPLVLYVRAHLAWRADLRRRRAERERHRAERAASARLYPNEENG